MVDLLYSYIGKIFKFFFRYVQQVQFGVKISVISISEKVIGIVNIMICCLSTFVIDGNSIFQAALLVFLSKDTDILNSIYPSFQDPVPLVKNSMKHVKGWD